MGNPNITDAAAPDGHPEKELAWGEIMTVMLEFIHKNPEKIAYLWPHVVRMKRIPLLVLDLEGIIARDNIV